LWKIELGESEEFLKGLEADGIETEALKTRPDIEGWPLECLNGFYLLNNKRVEGNIPLQEIQAYIQIMDIKEKQEFLYMICILDNALRNSNGN